jgi:rhodanese-related sulfurtransferase
LPTINRSIVVYAGGNRSEVAADAARQLVDLGYENVTWLAGGIGAWLYLGLPVERGGIRAAE